MRWPRSRNRILKLQELFKNYLYSLSEPELLKLLRYSISDMTDHSAMFISSNGTILNAEEISDTKDNISHLNILISAFIDHYRIKYNDTVDDLLDTDPNNFFDVLYDVVCNLLIEKFNWVKINSGTRLDDNNPYMVLPNSLSYQQHSILKDFLFFLREHGHKSLRVYPFSGEDNDVVYYFNEYTPDEIMDRIDTYYRTGQLLEELDYLNIDFPKVD